MPEDPLDTFVRLFVAYSIFVVQVMEIEARRMLSWLAYCVALIGIEVRYRGKRLWSRMSGRFRLALSLVGLARPLSWEEVEAERIRIEQQTGEPCPRSPELEDGLRRERLRAETPQRANAQEPSTPTERTSAHHPGVGLDTCSASRYPADEEEE